MIGVLTEPITADGIPATFQQYAGMPYWDFARPMAYEEGLTRHQILPSRTVYHALKTKGRAVMNWETGCGKTYAALIISKSLCEMPIVITPASIIKTWEAVCEELEIPAEIHSMEKVRMGGTWFYQKRGWRARNRLIVIDEAHLCENKRSLQGEMMLSLAQTDNKVLMMSATIGQKPERWASYWSVLRLRGFTSTITRYGRFGEDDVFYGDASSAIQEVRKQIFPLYGSVLTKKEIEEDFPKTEIVVRYVNRMGRMHVSLPRSMKANEGVKIPSITEWARDGAKEHAVVVLMKYVSSAKEVAKELRWPLITGATPRAVRQKICKDFNNDWIPGIVATLDTCSTGISLHGNAKARKRLSIISPDFNAITLKQALGRVNRLNGAESKQIIVLTRSRLDDVLLKRVRSKIKNMQHT